MEDGPQSDTPKEFVIRSGVRSGHKRELAFALKSQANISSSLSRTRSGKLPSPSLSPPSKKSKKKLQDSVKKSDICHDIIEEKEEEKAVADDTAIVVHYNNTVVSSNVLVEENGLLDKQQLLENDKQSSLSGLNASDEKLDLDAKSGEIVQNKASSPSKSLDRALLKAEDAATTAIIEPPLEHSDLVDDTVELKKEEKALLKAEDAATTAIIEPPLEHSDLVDDTVELKKEEKAVPENSAILFEQVEIADRYIESHEENGVSEKQLSLIKDKPSLLEQHNLDAKTGEVAKNKVSLPSRRFTRSLLKAEDVSVASISSSDELVELDDPSSKKMELKMSKKIGLNKLPSNVRDLLGTGLLEGLPVKYDTLVGKRCQLDGVIKGNGILCFCSSCKGCKAVSAFHFELHAGSTKNCPADYIFLNNGKSIGDVLRACTSAPLDLLASVIRNAIAEMPSTKQYTCQNCKESFHTPDAGKFALLCDSCLEQGNKQVSLMAPTIKLPKKSLGNSFKKTPSSRKKTLQTKVAEEVGPDSSSEKVSSLKTGKITKKDVSLHKLVFMDDILPEGTEVGYFVRGRKLLEGYIKDQGIYCHHCNCVVAPSGFEAHAGNASRRKPYHNIYTSNGVSLHELSVSLSKGRKKASKENDDLCCICGDGGDLLLCDLCPRAFHTECVGMSSIPEGDYECRYCQLMHEREKNVAYNANAIAAGRVAGVDPIEQIIQRCIRIVKTSNDIGSCVLCKCHDFSRSSFDDRTVIICDQCEEYHIGCLRLNNMCDLKELPKGKWFCCNTCSTIHATLQDLLFKPFPIQSAHVDIIKKRHEKNGSNYDGGNDVRWRLVSGKLSHAATKLLLSEAITIFHGSFSPIVDAAGRDLIPSMVYGREVGDQDYGGMYCAILTVNSSVVSAGILRILGTVAELPLVATSKDCQGLGYFQSLFSCIEDLLISLKVKHFVLPSADESEAIWVKKFGFVKITPEQLNEYAQGAHLMFFQGTSWLYKPVPDPSG